MPISDRFTPTQRRIYDVLQDGKFHTRDELHSCLPDDLSSNGSVRFHLSNVRKIVREFNMEIVCQIHGQMTHYRLIVPSDEE